MRPVSAPEPAPDVALAACLLSILEISWDDGPGPFSELPWGEWLAERNLGLVRTTELPGSGFWAAELEGGGRAVMFGSPPGPVHVAAPGGEPVAAWRFTTLDPVPARTGGAAAGPGRVEAIYVAADGGAACTALDEAEAVAGRGLRGDRYFDGTGEFSRAGRTGQDLTLIAAEDLEAVGTIDAAAARRNVVTRGIDLNALTGERFRVGDVQCLGRRWCEPCAHMQRLTRPGVLRDFVHRGGLRADVLTDGVIRLGDAVG